MIYFRSVQPHSWLHLFRWKHDRHTVAYSYNKMVSWYSIVYMLDVNNIILFILIVHNTVYFSTSSKTVNKKKTKNKIPKQKSYMFISQSAKKNIMWRGSSGWNETIWRTISTCCRRRDLLLVRHWEWCHFLCKRGKKKKGFVRRSQMIDWNAELYHVSNWWSPSSCQAVSVIILIIA